MKTRIKTSLCWKKACVCVLFYYFFFYCTCLFSFQCNGGVKKLVLDFILINEIWSKSLSGVHLFICPIIITQENDNQIESFFLPCQNGFLLQTNKSSTKKKFSIDIVKWVHSWVDLSRSDKVGLSQGESEAAMICCSVTLALFPCFFLLSETSTMMYMLNPSHFFFPKAKGAIMQVQRRANFLPWGVCSCLDWAKGSEKAERSQRSGAATPGWSASFAERVKTGRPWSESWQGCAVSFVWSTCSFFCLFFSFFASIYFYKDGHIANNTKNYWK